ncbi:hypothetical protein, partial [Acidaminococcus sp.]|uniref:hypothetical protein n=1 Tax=Acidaminococcus sp. TaxID=1872103 RepID=UPI003AB62507
IVSVPPRQKGGGLNKMGFYRTAFPTSLYLYRRKASLFTKNPAKKENAFPFSRDSKKQSHKRIWQGWFIIYYLSYLSIFPIYPHF